MNQHHLDADEPEEDDVLHDLLLQGFIDHGVAAVLDDNHLASVFPDVGERGGQDFGPLHIGQIVMHFITSISCGNPR